MQEKEKVARYVENRKTVCELTKPVDYEDLLIDHHQTLILQKCSKKQAASIQRKKINIKTPKHFYDNMLSR